MTTGSVQPAPPTNYDSPPITTVVAVLLLVFLFIGFFSMYFCQCFMQNILHTWHVRRSPTDTPVGGAASKAVLGLDPLIVKSFPSFSYSTVKGYRKEKYGLECAICLVEFQDIDVLRLLTSCCHVFHQECIDLWLETRKTCPVCRRDLDLDSTIRSPMKSPPHVNQDMVLSSDDHDDHHVSIAIKEVDPSDPEEIRVCENVVVHDDDDDTTNKAQILSKSHSTGHSIVRKKEEDDSKFVLRLPENVKSDIIRGYHHSSCKSWTTFGDHQSKPNT